MQFNEWDEVVIHQHGITVFATVVEDHPDKGVKVKIATGTYNTTKWIKDRSRITLRNGPDS